MPLPLNKHPGILAIGALVMGLLSGVIDPELGADDLAHQRHVLDGRPAAEARRRLDEAGAALDRELARPLDRLRGQERHLEDDLDDAPVGGLDHALDV